jgi:hypothetical protein
MQGASQVFVIPNGIEEIIGQWRVTREAGLKAAGHVACVL